MENYPVIEEKIFANTAFDFDSHVEAAQSSQIKTELAYSDRINGAFLYHGNCCWRAFKITRPCALNFTQAL
ncbi:MAG: hypothetical protein HZC43_04410 [Nitrosomonadales bacterium]|nr:hypothetical protein [Nitrosomonadales bacterium]